MLQPKQRWQPFFTQPPKGKTMNRKFLLIALLAASPAFASELDPFVTEPLPIIGVKSRAEVVAEVLQAQRQGQIARGELYPAAEVAVASSKSRDEVKAELAAARARGELARGEIYAPGFASQQIEPSVQ
jgi:hypothetical protein